MSCHCFSVWLLEDYPWKGPRWDCSKHQRCVFALTFLLQLFCFGLTPGARSEGNISVMKSHFIATIVGRELSSKRLLRFAAGISFIATSLLSARAGGDYVAHEWGTFTSVQGSDGVQLDWHAAQVSELPGFVYNWSNAGFDRISTSVMLKSDVVGRQRMETPVIYFYSKTEQTVDAAVKFPQGRITEWYPQAFQIGPALISPASLKTSHSLSNSEIRWTGVKLLNAERNAELASLLPVDPSGSHYFAARATDSAVLSTDCSSPTNALQHEKFLFYRGVGTFATPLQVGMNSGGALVVTNSGKEGLKHLFVLTVRNGGATFSMLDKLASGASQRFDGDLEKQFGPLDEVKQELERAMGEALASEGLYPREAAAMVDTWKDSWFSEDGVRVLYVLPRAWTDATLPLTLTPEPRELVRVMVGRAEVITPSVEKNLRRLLVESANGDAAARGEVVAELKKLGRFAEPALRLVHQHSGATGAESIEGQLLATATATAKN